MTHWIDVTADKILESYQNKDTLHFSGGLSVRGIQHIGRLRGEVFVGDAVKTVLQDKGKDIIQYLIVYDRDPMPEKALKKVFKDENLIKSLSYRRLEDLSDPYKCCDSWVEHYWKDFRDYLYDFRCNPTIIRTSDLYRTPKMQSVVKEVISKMEKAREISNRYRGENPYKEGWIPFEPQCPECGRIRFVEAKEAHLDSDSINYKCENCNSSGESKLSEGKLQWRLEWPALWKALDIEFEPYGKDHAASGGSRESCSVIAKEVLNIEPPFGFPYEWVSLKIHGKNLGEMTASGFVGITPRNWVEIAEPDVLRFFYLYPKPMSHIAVDIDELPSIVDRFDTAERIYYGLEKTEEDEDYIKRAYELAVKNPSLKIPLRIPYAHASLVSEISMISNDPSGAIKRLKKTGHLTEDLTENDILIVRSRLEKAYKWSEKYASDMYKIRISDDIKSIKAVLSPDQKDFLKCFADYLNSSSQYSGLDVHTAVYSIAEEKGLKANLLFRAGYMALFNKKYGPRFGELIANLDKDFVIERFRKISS